MRLRFVEFRLFDFIVYTLYKTNQVLESGSPNLDSESLTVWYQTKLRTEQHVGGNEGS